MSKFSIPHFSANAKSKADGFTLIEALVAITIFAFLGLGAYQILDNIVRVEEQALRKSQEMATLQKVVWQLGKDFRLMAQRPIVDGGDLKADIDLEGDYLIEFTRRGWSNPLNWQRSVLQRVAYSIDSHPDRDDSESPYYNDESLYLLRHYWQVLDRDFDSVPLTQVLLKDASDFYVRFYNENASSDDDLWSDQILRKSLPSDTGQFLVPNAVEVNIVLGDSNLFSYIFPVGAGGN